MIERKSKIVAKIADNRSEVFFLKSIFDAGADVAWLNTAHQDEEATIEVVNKIRSVNTNIPILIDTKGPEVRTKNVETPFEVKAEDYVTFTGDQSVTGHNVVQVTYANFHNEVPVGEVILYDDASIEMIVEEKLPNAIKCVVKNSGMIKSKKSLNIPNVHIQLPALSEKDKSFIHFCAKHNIDYIIHSFVRNISDLNEIKDITSKYPDYKGKIIAKIENREGFDNMKEILDNCEGLMVARGDLGAEVPLEELPYMQKKMVEACLEKGKYCIVATQVLESMIKSPRPTRAEVTDAANAILDGSGAISMSGETAYGDYPLEAVTTLGRIMKYAELKRDELVHFNTVPTVESKEYAEAKKIVTEADKIEAKAIVVVSSNAELSRAISAYRPSCVVMSAGIKEEEARELMLAYAARPLHSPSEDMKMILEKIRAESFLKEDDCVLLVTETEGKFHSKTGTLKDF
jgi:pyruvate kinase